VYIITLNIYNLNEEIWNLDGLANDNPQWGKGGVVIGLMNGKYN
jgi:hypothetical protein